MNTFQQIFLWRSDFPTLHCHHSNNTHNIKIPCRSVLQKWKRCACKYDLFLPKSDRWASYIRPVNSACAYRFSRHLITKDIAEFHGFPSPVTSVTARICVRLSAPRVGRRDQPHLFSDTVTKWGTQPSRYNRACRPSQMAWSEVQEMQVVESCNSPGQRIYSFAVSAKSRSWPSSWTRGSLLPIPMGNQIRSLSYSF